MKKIWLSLLLALVLLFSGCSNHIKEPSDTAVSTTHTEITGDCEGHRDDDNDGLCDLCRQSVVLYYDFYNINDLHGKFSDSVTQPGVDEMTTYLENMRKENDRVILLSTGDMWQGSSESNLTKGNLVTEWMNAIHTDAMILGNHEYDWGEDIIENNLSLVDFPFLAINIYNRKTDERVPYCDASLLIDRDGMQIGIIGAMGDCYSSIARDKTENVYFKTGDDLTALVKAESEHLKTLGADYIVYAIHDGYGNSMSGKTTLPSHKIASYYDTSLSDGYVDLVFEGHTHQSYVFKDNYGVYHLQGGGENKGITHAEVGLNFANGNSFVKEAEFIPNSVYEKEIPSEIIPTLLAKYQEEIAPAYRYIGQNDRQRNGDELRRKVADLYYEAGMKTWGTQYDIVLGGGFISVRNPKKLEMGDVTYSHLQMLFPFDNRLVLCSVKGSDLKANFFDTRNKNYFISYGDYGASVRRNLDPDATYYIVVDTYSSSYAPNRLTPIAYYDETVYARDLLADYIAAGGFSIQDPGIGGSYTLTSIADILKIGQSLKMNEETDALYYVKGKVESISGTRYGNLYLQDENGDRIYVYGVHSEDGKTRYEDLEIKPQVGDTIILKAPIQKYDNKGTVIIELFQARLVEIQK